MAERLDHTIERLQSLLTKVFERPVALTSSMQARDIEGWDSMMHVLVVQAIETEFRIRFRTGETTMARDIGELVRCIDRHLGAGRV